MLLEFVFSASPSRGHGERTADLIDAANGLPPMKSEISYLLALCHKISLSITLK